MKNLKISQAFNKTGSIYCVFNALYRCALKNPERIENCCYCEISRRDLMAAVGFGRTAVRDALLFLERNGFIRIESHCCQVSGWLKNRYVLIKILHSE